MIKHWLRAAGSMVVSLISFAQMLYAGGGVLEEGVLHYNLKSTLGDKYINKHISISILGKNVRVDVWQEKTMQQSVLLKDGAEPIMLNHEDETYEVYNEESKTANPNQKISIINKGTEKVKGYACKHFWVDMEGLTEAAKVWTSKAVVSEAVLNKIFQSGFLMGFDKSIIEAIKKEKLLGLPLRVKISNTHLIELDKVEKVKLSLGLFEKTKKYKPLQ